MAKPSVIYKVVPFEGGWQIQCEGLAYAPILRSSERDAVATAILIAQRSEPARVQVHDSSGKLVMDRVYGPAAL